MTASRDYRVGDTVCSFNDCRGTVARLHYFKGKLSSVTVKWFNGRVMTHPLTAEDIWLEGQPAKEHPELKRLKRLKEQQDEINATNTWLQEAYKAEVQKAKQANIAIDWVPEPMNESATLEELAEEISRWADVVQFLDACQDDDDIKHDVYTRVSLHATLNGLKKRGVAIPDDLLETLAKADQYFFENSFALEPPYIKHLENKAIGNAPITLLDLDAFWYEYRWPNAKSSG
jgi:hypothetical protein